MTPLSVIFVPVEVPTPAAGSPGWIKPTKPGRRHHRARRADWPLRQPIPQREPIDRQLADQLLRQGKRILAEAHARG
jgi:hypothetical protein